MEIPRVARDDNKNQREKPMLVIGLTGGIGSGKSTVAKAFAKQGITIIDTDEIAREVVAPKTPGLKKIAAHFGRDILDKNGELQRKKLAAIVFAKPAERRWLENLLHPLIRKKTKALLKKVTSAYCIVIIPLLAETKPNPFIQRALVVDAPTAQRSKRTQQRDKLSVQQVKKIIGSQVTRKQRLALADDVIKNNRDLHYLKTQVLSLHKKYLSLATI
jgi:dephospho-CoA kinase